MILPERFTALREVGAGGMGVVYEVRDAKFEGARRALKVLRAGAEDDPHARAMFVREVTATASIQSEHVVQVVDYDLTAPSPWLLMELLDGETLDAHVAARGPLPWDEARRLAAELGHALRAAHAVGVLHLDLKPSNLFLARAADARGSTRLKVLDFGLSRRVASGESHVVQSRAVGTIAWMPPEQCARRAELRATADVWPLGLIAFWMLTATSYWRSVDARGDIDDLQHFYGELAAGATSPASVRAAERGGERALPAGFDAWFARCVASDPNARWADGGVASAALDALLGDGLALAPETTAPPQVAPLREVPPAAPRGLRWARWGLAAGVAGALAALGAVALSRTTEAPVARVRGAVSGDAGPPGVVAGVSGYAPPQCRLPSQRAVIAGLVGVAQLAAGGTHACARRVDGTLRCWGENASGELGDGTDEDRAAPTAVPGETAVAEVSLGVQTTCARRTDGTVACWGRGVVPDGDAITTLRPRTIDGVRGATQVATGQGFACARTADGGLWCWGQNDAGQLGRGEADGNRYGPARVVGVGPVAAVAAGVDHACARTDDGAVWCWGQSSHGELGDGRHPRGGRGTPVRVVGVDDAVELALGSGWSCARTREGTVRCWGANESGQLGAGDVAQRDEAAAVPGVSGAVGIAVGERHACALGADGAAVCWGSNSFCQQGGGRNDARRGPAAAQGVAAMAALAAGSAHTCGLLREGAVRCWGWNRLGQLGDGAPTDAVEMSPEALR